MPQTMLPRDATTVPYMLTVIEQPTHEQACVWWESMQSDDLEVAYADSFPPTLAHFQDEVAQGEKWLTLGLVDGQVAGAMWLHDLLRRPHGTVSGGWIGCYFLPPYRGQLAVDLWKLAHQHWEAAGVVHFFTAVNVANRRSQAFVTRGAYFTRVGKYRHFTICHGQPTDMFIYTLHAADNALAWRLAEERAARQMLGVAV